MASFEISVGMSGLQETWITNQTSCIRSFYGFVVVVSITVSPSTSVDNDDAETQFCCEAPEGVCGLKIQPTFHHLSAE